jgi:hypothetical protein
MCNSKTAGAFGTGLQIAGTIQQMQSIGAYSDYAAGVAERNAAISNAQAENALYQGADEERQIRQRTRQLAATQKAAMSANGVDISGGSPLAVLSDTAYLGELDAQTSRYNTAQNVWSYRNQANDYMNQASAARAYGKNAKSAALLNGLTSVAQYYSQFGESAQRRPSTKYGTISPIY